VRLETVENAIAKALFSKTVSHFFSLVVQHKAAALLSQW
jgi:hypothetical protein